MKVCVCLYKYVLRGTLCCYCVVYSSLILKWMVFVAAGNVNSSHFFILVYIKCKMRLMKWKPCDFILLSIIILMLLGHVRLYFLFSCVMQCPVRYVVLLLWVTYRLFLLTVHLRAPGYKSLILIVHLSPSGYIIYIDSTYQCSRIRYLCG